MKSIEKKHSVMDPSAIGLFSLAIVTLVASSQKLEWTENNAGMIAWALILGGLGQVIAGIYDAKINNVFGATAFFAYGLFWLGTGFTWMIQAGVFGQNLAADFDAKQIGFAFIGYLVFTLFMTIGALETNKLLFFIFFVINFLYLGLALSTLGIMPELFHQLAAWAEFTVSILSLYGCGAAVLNAHFGFTFLPIGKKFNIIKQTEQ
ncbi:acetate uptake transporter [Brochothrix campestris]|uniref:Uncharacterized protein n=1 Tax=Brochothrix campestris FSL F6-1037 TaxID=1265861 RepID=W7CTN2_9LIST|nr:GPR1/FUN34/YaaH family transporter [Brochothrix campestris]EUJ36288.1 hypothetical protein BCAMP_10765 [Brochothrix campestris FSL F6-1037]